METCSECGRKFDLEDLIDTGCDDDGGELFTIYVCRWCAELITGDYFESGEDADV